MAVHAVPRAAARPQPASPRASVAGHAPTHARRPRRTLLASHVPAVVASVRRIVRGQNLAHAVPVLAHPMPTRLLRGVRLA